MENQTHQSFNEKTVEIHLGSSNFQNFKGFPKKMPFLKEFEGSQRYRSKKEQEGFTSLQGLPEYLPNLQGFYFARNLLTDLQGFPSEMPKLIELNLKQNRLRTLKGISPRLPNVEFIDISFNALRSTDYFPAHCPKLKHLFLNSNNLDLLEDLPKYPDQLVELQLDHNNLSSLKGIPKKLNPDTFIKLNQNPIRSLYGITKENVMAILNSIEENYKHLQLAVYGQNLLNNFYSNREQMGNIEKLLIYYEKSPAELANSYCKLDFKMPKRQIDRLLHEGNYEERRILEAEKERDDPIIASLTERLRIQKKYRILR
ncbi:hypothetical protein [Candidatus Lokiarchaeum ossiferum]|uniref:hypothetical protein n=1 Tax=Candidatus Lokiarchaeum ossiferum TaxID=2951803 RepID=UPI00352F8C96